MAPNMGTGQHGTQHGDRSHHDRDCGTECSSDWAGSSQVQLRQHLALNPLNVSGNLT